MMDNWTTYVFKHHQVVDEIDTLCLEEFPDCLAAFPFLVR